MLKLTLRWSLGLGEVGERWQKGHLYHETYFVKLLLKENVEQSQRNGVSCVCLNWQSSGSEVGLQIHKGLLVGLQIHKGDGKCCIDEATGCLFGLISLIWDIFAT